MRIFRVCKQLNIQENGQILVLALIVVALCSLIIVALVNFMGTGLNAVRVYRENTDRLYAADAGIQNGIWEIHSGANVNPPPVTVNGNSVLVTITSGWSLSGIVDPVYGPHNQWLDVQTSGNGDITGVYTINLIFNDLGKGNKKVTKMGVWLPAGYTYVAGSCNDPAFPNNIDKNPPSLTQVHGGTSITWTDFTYSFTQSGDTAYQKFRFTPVGKIPKGDIAWVASLSADIGLSWDQMIGDYVITSVATKDGKNTTIVAHLSVDTGTTPNVAIITYTISN